MNTKSGGRGSLYEMVSARAPLSLFLMITASIFVVELLIMILLIAWGPMQVWAQVLVDATCLVLMLFPILYFFMFRPMNTHITELFRTQDRLRVEVAERTEAEKTLKVSERKLHELSSELLRIQEKERRRVSIELHEDLGATLAALKLSLRFIAGALHPDQDELRAECEESLKNLDVLIENVRRLSRELRPSTLEDIGLCAALGRLVTGIARDRRLQVSLDLANIDHLFNEEARINIYRIFQEALSNVGRHSEAKCVSMTVARSNGSVSFSLEDDGKGFDLQRTEMKLGMTSMIERGRILGGTLDVVRPANGGTRIVLTIPVAG